MARFLGIDYGLARTGLAICDVDEKIVFPLATLRLGDFASRSSQLDALANLALAEKAENIVIGWPLLEDGSQGSMCAVVRNVVKKIRRRLDLPVYYMPEILSSVEARQDLVQAGLGRRKLKAVLDQQAACRILRSFLDLPPEKRIQA